MPTINSANAKRLGIYCFYDAHGEAASFIPVFLDELTQHLTDLVIVVNGELSQTSRAMFEHYTSDIVVRENKGLDAAAYRQIMLSKGWERLQEYDEVICLNDTIMGPIYPFSEMFKKMDSEDLDFWGITTYHGEKLGKEEIPTHLQAFWHAYRRSFLSSKVFQEYWENFPELTDYEAVTHKHEIPFTDHFAKMGYKWESYIDCERYSSLASYPLLFMPKQLIEDQRCPIIKRRTFFLDYSFAFSQTAGEPALELYDYLRDKQLYDVNLVWDTLLPSYNIADLQRIMHLNYVLPMSSVTHADSAALPKAAFIFHAYFMDLLPQSFHYLSSLPGTVDLFITTPKEKVSDLKKFIDKNGISRKINIIPVENRGRDVSALFVAAKDVVISGEYEVIGFAHDKKSSQNLSKGHHGSESQGFGYKLLENTLASESYVKNILQKFNDEPRLGLLTPPPPIHGLYFAHTIPTDWGSNFKNTKALLNNRLGLRVPLNPLKPTVSAIGSCYWFRRDALRPLFEAGWEYSDFLPEGLMDEDGTVSHAIERANGYVAQARGYFPAWVLSDKYARIELTSLWYSTSELVGAFGPKRQGETLLELELWGNRRIKGSLSRLSFALHRGLKKMSSRTVRKMPDPIQNVIYRVFWSPIAAYRALRHWVGGKLRPRVEADPEVLKLTSKAVNRGRKSKNRNVSQR